MMLMRTHLAIGLLFALLFVRIMPYPLFFVLVVLAASIIPDIDVKNSHLGRHFVFRPLQWFVKHRGVMHSLSFCILISLILSFIWPWLAFGFFIGYGVHIISDGFTKDGIRPFWPHKGEVKGFIKTGGASEYIVLTGILFLDLIAFVNLF